MKRIGEACGGEGGSPPFFPSPTHLFLFFFFVLPDLILPLITAGVSLIILIVFITVTCLLKRKKKSVVSGDAGGPSIVVYPSHQGSCLQFSWVWGGGEEGKNNFFFSKKNQFTYLYFPRRTKDILFSLPPLRHSNSLGDLNGIDLDENDSDDGNTEPLILTERKRNRRSNSFSCYGLGVIDPALYGNCTIDLEEDVQFPDDHIGRLWFSVRYENATEKLLVSILKAKNLPSRTVGTVNGCDPFIRLHLLPDERRYQQSKVKKKSCNPFFDETFVFQVLNPTFSHLPHVPRRSKQSNN